VSVGRDEPSVRRAADGSGRAESPTQRFALVAREREVFRLALIRAPQADDLALETALRVERSSRSARGGAGREGLGR
jgi:hypothetical protein